MYTFSLLLGFGSVLGLAWSAWQAPENRRQSVIDAGLGALIGALVGGRAVYAAVQWPYFQAHLLELPQVWLGGFSGVGALAGAMAGLVLFSIVVDTNQRFISYQRSVSTGWQKLSPNNGLVAAHRWFATADALLPLLASLVVIAWLACWLDASAYGAPVTSWLGLPARDEMGNIASRLPAQLIGAVLALGLFWGLETLRPQLPFPGLAASLGLLGLSLEIFGLSFLRADPIPLWHSLRLDAWGALGTGCLASVFLLLTCMLRPNRNGGQG